MNNQVASAVIKELDEMRKLVGDMDFGPMKALKMLAEDDSELRAICDEPMSICEIADMLIEIATIKGVLV